MGLMLFLDDFLEVLQTMSAPLPEDDTKKLLLAHEKNKEGQVDPNEFLGGKKYINKLYLMSSFEGKKKKKKGGKGGRTPASLLITWTYVCTVHVFSIVHNY